MEVDHTYAMKTDFFRDHSYATLRENNDNSDSLRHNIRLADLSSFPCQKLVVSNISYSIFDVPNDGNCFFHCLSLSIFGNFEKTGSLRNMICSHIVQNWQLWEDKVSACYDPRMDLQKYIGHMVTRNGWATAAEVEAAAILLSCNIHVILEGRNVYISQTCSSNDTFSEIDIELLLARNHYRVLRKDLMEQNKTVLALDNYHTNQKQKRKKPGFENPKSYTATQINNENEKHTQTYSALKANKKRKVFNLSMAEKKLDAESTKTKFPDNTSIQTVNNIDEPETHFLCRKYGVIYERPVQNETVKEAKNRRKRNRTKINNRKKKFENLELQILDPPPLSSDEKQNTAMNSIRIFELEQMSYSIRTCSICHECRLEMKMSPKDNICRRCFSDKNQIKLYSSENDMNPGKLPSELCDMTIIEQQLISKITPCINVHLLNHGGIASSGHFVTFPQEVNQPSQILPRLPKDIKILKVRKRGENDISKEFTVRRFKVHNALLWLKKNNPVYSDINISQDRLELLPIDGEMPDIETLEYSDKTIHQSDRGPAPDQIDIGEVDGITNSSVLPDPFINIREKVQNVIDEIADGENQNETMVNKRGIVTIPWPTSGDIPISEFVASNFFTMAFPCLFPYGSGDFHVNRPRTCESMADWAEHLLWFEDGRFANHQYFKFVVHNMIMRKRAIENSTLIVKQELGDAHLSVSDIRDKMQNGDNSIIKKIIYLSSNLRGSNQYWAQKAKELRSLVQYNINEGCGLPSYFCTGKCTEFYFKPLRRLLTNYIKSTKGIEIDLNEKSKLFEAIQENGHLVGHYFDLRTQSYFNRVMGPVFNVNCYWYRQEFTKSRGMIHWQGFCWRKDMEPHNLMSKAFEDGLSDFECADKLAKWASSELGMSASHPAGKGDDGNPRKDLWPPPEGTAPAPREENNPLVKLLMDTSVSQNSLLEDYLLLTNRINIHQCSDYCLRQRGPRKEKTCRMEFGTLSSPGKELRNKPAIVRVKNKSMRLEMPRDHPMLVQNSRLHTQGWRANGDFSIIVSKSDPANPSIDEILATEKYITGYACKGDKPTGAIADLVQYMGNCADENSGAIAKSLCSELLIGTVKRDVSSVEASYELSGLPLYRSSHTFQSVSLTGFRDIDFSKPESTVTENTILDKYLNRDEQDKTSLYSFICRQGKVPVISTLTVSFPLEEEYCRVTLLMHWPNWRKIEDIRTDEVSWTSAMEDFLQSKECPNFIKAEVERAKQHHTDRNMNDDENDPNDLGEIDEPEWMTKCPI